LAYGPCCVCHKGYKRRVRAASRQTQFVARGDDMHRETAVIMS